MAMATVFPKELRCVPKPFVVLTGLDITYNAVHKSIWDTFSNNRRADRLQIKFACLPGDHAFPRCKTKRSSYDWYIPKGILKTKWMEKHLNEVPSLVVIFFELDWDELAWRERHLACASRVQVIRSSLQGRTTKVAVVLIQRSTPLPPGEDMVAAERAAALCSACDLSSKSLFVLPHSDHLLGYIIRLETAFFDLAQTYYHSELRRVKAHKEFLSKTTHQLLFPRHQFKIAFYYELMQDSNNALKHYQQSYAHIHELRSHATNNLEVKFVGGLVNFKICRLCFLQLNAPLDAINQFRRHIDQFKPQCGNPDLMFEHYAWLSQQYLQFADLFKNAIDQGLTAIQTQHPGFYYQEAAHFAELRKLHALSLKPAVDALGYPSSRPLDVQVLDFYGQRPWRQGHQRIDPPDLALEKDGILAIQKEELNEDHPWIIIPLLSSAIAQFKKFHCPRLRRHLTIKMGIEYYHAKEYSNVIIYLNRAIAEYRSTQWCQILTQLGTLIFHCAYLLADMETYFACSLELMGKYSCLSVDDKTKIQKNVCQLLGGEVPQAITLSSQICSLDDHTVEKETTIQAWRNILGKNEERICTLEMNNLLSFVECKVKFSQDEFHLDQSATLTVFTRITCPSLFQFTDLSVSLSNPTYDKNCVVPIGKLCYQPNDVNQHVFEFPIEMTDLNKTIQVKDVALSLGSSNMNGIKVLLKWKRFENGLQFNELERYEYSERLGAASFAQWRNISETCSSQVVHRKSCLEIEVCNSAPALTNETFPVTISVKSKESKALAENVAVLVSLKPEINQDDQLYQSTNLILDFESATNTKTLEFDLDDLEPENISKKVVYLCPKMAGRISVSVQVTYKVANIPVMSVLSNNKELQLIKCACKSTADISVDIIDPLKLTAHVTSMNMQSVSSVYVGQPFIMLASLVVHSPWPLEILSCQHILPKLSNLSLMSKPQLLDTILILHENETIIDCSSVVLNEESELLADSSDLGLYKVKWKRSGSNAPVAVSEIKLPSVLTKEFPLKLSAVVPAECELRKYVEITYTITNNSNEYQIVEVTYNAAETFMFSGQKHTKIFLSPNETHKLVYVLIPLALGYQLLPLMNVTAINIQKKDQVESVQKESLDNFFLHSSIPTHLYVKPTTI